MAPNKSQSVPEKAKGVLPEHAQHIYKAAHDHALKEYKSPSKRRSKSDDLEAAAHKVAWSAVKKEYRKDKNSGKWIKK